MHKYHAEESLFRRIIFSEIASGVPSFLLACGMLGAFGLMAATLSPWLTVGSLLPFGSFWIWWQLRLGEGQDTPQAGVGDQGPAPDSSSLPFSLHSGLQSCLSGLPILRTQLNESAEQIQRGAQETGQRLSELSVGIEAMREQLEHVQRIVKKIGPEQNEQEELQELQKCTAHAVRGNQTLAEETRLARVEIQHYATINQRLAHIIDAMVELEYGLLAPAAGREAGLGANPAQGWTKRLEQRFSGCVAPWSRPTAGPAADVSLTGSDVSRTGPDGQAQTREHQNQQAQFEGDVGLL